MKNTFGSLATHLAMTTFCWLPPERFLTNCRCGSEVLTVSFFTRSSAVLFSRLRSTTPSAPVIRSSTTIVTFSSIVLGMMSPSCRRFSVT